MPEHFISTQQFKYYIGKGAFALLHVSVYMCVYHHLIGTH